MMEFQGFVAPEADLPDGETIYAGLRDYTYEVSLVNRWGPCVEQMGVHFHLGEDTVTVKWGKDTGFEKINDPNNLLEVDPDDYLLEYNQDTSILKLTFDVFYTLNQTINVEVYTEGFASMKHLGDSQMLYAGKMNTKVKMIGEMTVHTYDMDDGREREVQSGDWVRSNKTLEFTGLKLIYDGTENFPSEFGVEPFYPPNDACHIEMMNTLNELSTDYDISGRDIWLLSRVGTMPLTILYESEIVGIKPENILRDIPDFYIHVDTDTPGTPSGIRIHADSFDDDQVIVDNDGELYVTWEKATEYNSGIDHYELIVNGDDSNIITVDQEFAKINTSDTGDVMIEVRAIDRVGYVGDYGSNSIFIDDQTLTYSGFTPDPEDDIWFNTLKPQVMVTVSDVGGRAVIGETVEYQVSHDNGEIYSDWIDANQMLRAKDLMIKVNPDLVEGDQNLIRFRASDEAGNIEISDPYRIRADISGVEFGEPHIDGEELSSMGWLDSGDFQLSIDIEDSYTGVDQDTIEYRYSTRGRADLETTSWTGFAGSLSGNTLSMEMSMPQGDDNFIQFRAMDNIGNSFTYTQPFNIWVNTDPVIVVNSPSHGQEVLEGNVILFDATDSSDYDGDHLNATWTDTYTYQGSTEEMELGDDAEDSLRFEQTLPPGDHSVVLTITDGLHEVKSEMINISVIPREDPIWMDPTLDSDDDGMDNLWEYTYHLPWDSDKNAGEEISDSNDFDGDGYSDLIEYREGTNPTDFLDFPVEKYSGEEEEDSKILGIFDTVWLFLAVLIPILILLAAIITLFGFMMQTKSSIKEAEEKEAKEQEDLTKRSLESGGRDRLEALKAASEGKGMPNLPMGEPGMEGSALPPAQQPEGQPMEAAPMEPTQGGAQPAPMPAQPMEGQPTQGQQVQNDQNAYNQGAQ